MHRPAAEVEAAALEKLREAVREDAERAPGPAARVLWELEGERMLRSAARYRQQWQAFVAHWDEVDVSPRPHFFEDERER